MKMWLSYIFCCQRQPQIIYFAMQFIAQWFTYFIAFNMHDYALNELINRINKEIQSTTLKTSDDVSLGSEVSECANYHRRQLTKWEKYKNAERVIWKNKMIFFLITLSSMNARKKTTSKTPVCHKCICATINCSFFT